MNNIKETIKTHLGFIIGLIIGIIFVVCGLSFFIVNIMIMIGFGLLGNYYQNNKEKVKMTLKSWIDKL